MRTPKLTDEDLQSHLQNLPDWTRDGDALVKTYAFPDFAHAMMFVNQVAQTAEAVNHHPDIDIRFSKVTLTLTTHDSGGLTQNDIDLAASADGIFNAVNP